jgi:hypothetical protein
MTETVVQKEFVEELRAIRKDLNYIKEHMVDADTLLSPEEEARVDAALQEYKKGKVLSLEKFKKGLSCKR